MQSVRLILPLSVVTSVFFVTSLATRNGGDQSKLKGKSLLSQDVHLADNLAEEKEENLGSLASPSLVNPKWASHISHGHTGHKAKPSSFESSFQWRPSQTIPDHFSAVIPPSSFQNRGPALVPFRSEEGLSFFENQSTQNSQFGGGPVDRPLRETFAEERQFRPERPPLPPPPPGQPLPQRPQRGPPRNLGRPVFLQDNPALSPPPPPRPTPSSFNLPTPTHPDISLIPLQDSGVSGVNDLLEERFPPFNDEPLSPAQLAAVSRDPAVTTQQPFLQFITQDEPLPLSHQSPGELTQQVPLSQLLETPRSHPRQNSTNRPRHLGSLFPQSQQQRVTPITQQPATTPTQKPTPPPTQPIRVEPSQPPQSPNDVTHGIFPGLNPSHRPFFEGPTAQFSFDGLSGPSFEQIPQLLPPPQFPPQELNHIPQEPPLSSAKPTVPRPPRQKTQPGFQQPFRPAPAQKPTGQEPPEEEAFPPQNQPFTAPNPLPPHSDPSPPPAPSSGPTGRPSFPFQFQRPPQRPARGQPNFRPPPPPPLRGRRRPIPVRILDPRRLRQQTTPPVPQNVASRRPRSEGPFQAREHSAEGQFQQGLISPFASVWAALQYVFEPPRRTTHAARGRRLRF
ncbi:basic proline-rich protein-like [Macrobrachium nipponense]|uniref:basic proline-rich protein-like n=1 Tax=Macrobrachium nipponense TaxID=159736 RepID=UPI0030C83003